MEQLKQMRAQIHEIDCNLLRLLARRQALSRQIGEQKRKAKAPVLCLAQREKVMLRNQKLGVTLGLRRKLVAQLWKLIHAESIRLQRRQR